MTFPCGRTIGAAVGRVQLGGAPWTYRKAMGSCLQIRGFCVRSIRAQESRAAIW
jgi:hypothetical protein